MDDSYYYQILSDYVGLPIEGEYQLMQTLSTLAGMQKEYDKVKEALDLPLPVHQDHRHDQDHAEKYHQRKTKGSF